MKIYALILVLAVLVASQQFAEAADDKEAMAMVMKMAQECIKEAGVNEADAKMILDDKLDEMDEKNFSSNMKCFLLCFYKKLGLLDAAGKPVPEKLQIFMEERYNEQKDKVKPALLKCSTIKDANPCEMVYKFEVCMSDNITG